MSLDVILSWDEHFPYSSQAWASFFSEYTVQWPMIWDAWRSYDDVLRTISPDMWKVFDVIHTRVEKGNIPRSLGQYYGCWCHGGTTSRTSATILFIMYEKRIVFSLTNYFTTRTSCIQCTNGNKCIFSVSWNKLRTTTANAHRAMPML